MLLSEAQYEHDCVAKRHNHEARQDGAGHAHLQTALRQEYEHSGSGGRDGARHDHLPCNVRGEENTGRHVDTPAEGEGGRQAPK